jgi:hypothetical protein
MWFAMRWDPTRSPWRQPMAAASDFPESPPAEKSTESSVAGGGMGKGGARVCGERPGGVSTLLRNQFGHSGVCPRCSLP